MAKRTTEHQRIWDTLIKQIKATIKRAEKRGYVFQVDDVLPDKPKRITERMLERLKYIKEDIYHFARYVDPRTGFIVSGKEGRKIERKRAAKKGQETKQRNKEIEEYYDDLPPEMDSVIEKVRYYLDELKSRVDNFQEDEKWSKWLKEQKRKDANKLKNILNTLESSLNSEAQQISFLKNMEQNAGEINSAIDFILYASGSAERAIDDTYFPELIELLFNRTLTSEEAKAVSSEPWGESYGEEV